MDFRLFDAVLDYVEERERTVFCLVIVASSLLSFLVFVNSKTFAGFFGKFAASMGVTVSALYSLTSNENRRLAVIALVFSSVFLFFAVFQGADDCFAWNPHISQNPVTGKCEAFIYGGCGPKPDPWYYHECSQESKQKLCSNITEVVDNSPEHFERMVCN